MTVVPVVVTFIGVCISEFFKSRFSKEKIPPIATKVNDKNNIVPVQKPMNAMTIDELWKKLDELTNKLEIDALSQTLVNHRFTDIHCPSKTALKVCESYLHANLLSMPITNVRFIASQAPLKEDLNIFWRGVFEGDYMIVDLTTLHDIQEEERYYPSTFEDPLNLKDFKISLIKEDGFFKEYSIIEKSTNEEKIIRRYHFQNWKDFSAVTVPILDDLVKLLEKENNLWVHCRAGVGRTGTLITALFLKRMVEKGEITKENLDSTLLDLIVELRKQRGRCFVQQPAQLQLLLDYGLFLVK
jgi:protein tyrosine phosphatase